MPDHASEADGTEQEVGVGRRPYAELHIRPTCGPPPLHSSTRAAKPRGASLSVVARLAHWGRYPPLSACTISSSPSASRAVAGSNTICWR
jgi:hypothetical protein